MCTYVYVHMCILPYAENKAPAIQPKDRPPVLIYIYIYMCVYIYV